MAKSAPNIGRYQQPLNHLAQLEVRFNNFVDIVLINIGVPDRFGIDHSHRPRGAAIQATGFVDADLACTRQTRFFNLRLAAVKAFLGAVISATVLTAAALVQAKEYMPLVI